ncbi:MAG TPA: HDIG domain-containing protein [Gemmatimonadales bacterium]|nr:HDIG domain-containing protein [Gemmatimonadales bacterium]
MLRALGRGLRFHAARWALALAVAAVTYLVFPSATADSRVLSIGRIADRDIFSPIGFAVRKTDAEIAREAEARAAAVRPIYTFSEAATDSILGAIRVFFGALERSRAIQPAVVRGVADAHGIVLTEEEAHYLASPAYRRALGEALVGFMARFLSQGVADAGPLREELHSQVVLRRGPAELLVSRDSILTFADLMARAEEVAPRPGTEFGERVFRKLVGTFFRPNVRLDRDLTDARREELRRGVDTLKYRVAPGERLVGSGQLVTAEVHERLVALDDALQRRGGQARVARTVVGQVLFNGIVVGVFWLLLLIYRRPTYDSLREVAFFAALFALVVMASGVVLGLFPSRPELIPIPFAAILVTMLYNGRVAVMAAGTLAILLGGQWALRDSNILLFGLVGGVAAALGMRVVRRRRHLYFTFGAVTVAYVLVGATLALLFEWTAEMLLWSSVAGAVNALGGASLALILVPLAESATRITTDLSLLELSDPSRPLLRRLALEAPGTYAHSFAMANLCEAACNAIGANGLLARVGCYYHDIGKLKHPQFFIENQVRGMNPHEVLSPAESARIIREHVADGLALAEEAGLPEAVKAFIPEHHGTLRLTYFLERAREHEPDVDPARFRYPGPIPRSAETAVAMLADSIEAAIRVLDAPTPAQVRGVVEHLVNQRIADGQLRDAPLTLRDLERVKDEFVRLTTGMYHDRIEYPRALGGVTRDFERLPHG